MNKAQFIGFIRKPGNLEEKDVSLLKDVGDTFPYCQIAHMLTAKVTHSTNSMYASEMLKRAATYANDRSVLKTLIRKTEKTATPASAEKPAETNTTTSAVEKKDTPATAVSPAKETKVDPTPTSTEKAVTTPPEEKKAEEAPKEESGSIADRIQQTLERTVEAKKKVEDFLESDERAAKAEEKNTPAPPAEDKASHSAKKDEPKEETKPDTSDFIKKKATEDAKSDELDIGYSVFSSRLGNALQPFDDVTQEEPFLVWSYNAIITPESPVSKSDIIDEFIKKSPSISRVNKGDDAEGKLENLADKSIKRKKSPVTETLAKLYLAQGNTKKALKIYKDLLLKNPEKSAYFAAQIEKLNK